MPYHSQIFARKPAGGMAAAPGESALLYHVKHASRHPFFNDSPVLLISEENNFSEYLAPN